MNQTILKKIEIYNLVIGAIYVILSLFLRSTSKTLGVAFGALLMILNFSLMAFLIKKAFMPGKMRLYPFLLNVVKFLALIAIVYLIFKWNLVNKLFFIAGTTVVIVSLVLVAVFHRDNEEKEQEDTK
jgi:hypothetical protein